MKKKLDPAGSWRKKKNSVHFAASGKMLTYSDPKHRDSNLVIWHRGPHRPPPPEVDHAIPAVYPALRHPAAPPVVCTQT